MGQKSRQHYVPKFYLRNFSETDKSISTFNIMNSLYIQNASIKDMCQRNNFYGDDKVVEDFLDKEIERKAARIIKKIIDTNSILDFVNEIEDYEHLLTFLLVSEGRNLRSADSAENAADKLIKTMIKGHPDFKEVDLDQFEIKINQPANNIIGIALESTPLIYDLEPILILQKTSRKFITSDNPLVRYNSFYIGRNYYGRGFGLVTRGLQLFLPISPQHCLLFYDSLAYDIPGEENGVLTLKRAREIDYLNELFYLNSYNNTFFNQRIKEDYIRKIHNKNRNTSKINELDKEVKFYNSSEDNDQIISLLHNRVTKKITLPWITDSKFAKSLVLPRHMGGLQRMESPIIGEYMKNARANFENQR
ncbi:DUF4238 domain-containing protein [Bacillus subtilis]|uniref:DUF4238 domain-containing protein n=1 Tax=Bacillus subtilis TaxID=1423 RepID=UPI0024ACAACA|nr:DUF4238 domain-containing protein [Bacillus subtilis]MDI6583692.1 DUF4238 domain-containing protein [Bacillus subtilis]